MITVKQQVINLRRTIVNSLFNIIVYSIGISMIMVGLLILSYLIQLCLNICLGTNSQIVEIETFRIPCYVWTLGWVITIITGVLIDLDKRYLQNN